MEMGLPQGLVMLGRALTAVPVACIKQIQEQMGNGAGSSPGHSPALPWSIGEADERSFSSHLSQIINPTCRHQCPHFTDLEVGVAKQGFEATC